MIDLCLLFLDEATANTVLFDTELSTKPVLVTDPALELVLDPLQLADAQIDQTVAYQGKTYMADAGKWYELVEYPKPISPKYQAIDMIGPIEGSPGYHANVRTTEEAPELDAYRVYPVTPARVWF